MTSQNVATDVLRTLHRIHRQLTDLRERRDRGPKQIKAAERHVEYQQEQLETLRKEALALRMSSDAKQVQLKAGEDKVEELKGKLNAASSNREFQALKDQMAAQEMTNSVLADEILEGLDKIDESLEKVAQAEKVLQAAREKLDKVRHEVQQQEPLILGDLERLEGELKQCEANLPPGVRDLYDRLVRHKGEDALAAIENQHCSGCNQQVPINVCAQILLNQPKFCIACGRLLYMPEESPPGAGVDI